MAGEHAEVDALEQKVSRLESSLERLPGALVAFSGGVDSTLLLAIALDVLGVERVIAVTAVSPSLPAAEQAAAVELTRELGAAHRLLDTSEIDRHDYARNSSNRCYFCKTELFEQMERWIRSANLPEWPILYGAIADDLGDHRPGHRAAAEHGVGAPLAECGFTKDEVRRYSRARGLPTWNKPSFACLASRVPYGTHIDRALLHRIERAEDYLRSRGFRQFRVRHHEQIARIELGAEELGRAAGPERAGIVDALESLGYAYVTLDLRGFRSGSMNEVVAGASTLVDRQHPQRHG